MVLIESLDDDGYLPTRSREIAARLDDPIRRRTREETWSTGCAAALRFLQSMEPTA